MVAMGAFPLQAEFLAIGDEVALAIPMMKVAPVGAEVLPVALPATVGALPVPDPWAEVVPVALPATVGALPVLDLWAEVVPLALPRAMCCGAVAS